MSGYSTYRKNESCAHHMMRVASHGDASNMLCFITHEMPDLTKIPLRNSTPADIAQQMCNDLSIACRSYVNKTLPEGLENNAKLLAALTNVFQQNIDMPPYQVIGKALNAFSAWRAECRIKHPSKNNYDQDTRHKKVKNAAKEALTMLCLSKIECSNKEDVYLTLAQPKRQAHVEIHISESQYTIAEKSKDLRLKIQYKDPLFVLNHILLKNVIGRQGSLYGRHVPDLFTLTYISLTEKDWNNNRPWIMHTVQTKNVVPQHQFRTQMELAPAQDNNVKHSESIDETSYNSWWEKNKKEAAKIWRIIRRQRNATTPLKENLMNAPTGDLVARLKEIGPTALIEGALAKFEPDAKMALIARIHPELVPIYKTCLAVEEAIGPIPEHIEAQLRNYWPSHKKNQPHVTAADMINCGDLV